MAGELLRLTGVLTNTLAPPEALAALIGSQRLSRGYILLAVAVGSRLPEILCHELGWNAGFLLPIGQTLFLLGWATILVTAQRNPPAASLILTIAALCFSWSVIAPWLERTAVVQSAFHNLSWSGRFYVSRLLRLSGAVLISLTFLCASVRRRELFLYRGNWHAPVQNVPFSLGRISWAWLALTLSLVFSIAIWLYFAATTALDFSRVATLPPLLLSCLPIAALNAANEEFQFRSALLARLHHVVSPQDAALVCGAIFGIDHYFGYPGGWGGVLLAGMAGWVWACSMLETRGFTWAFATHFVQDMFIFALLALSVSPA